MKNDIINILAGVTMVAAILFLTFYDPAPEGIDFKHAKEELYNDTGYLTEINEVEGTYEITCDCCHNN